MRRNFLVSLLLGILWLSISTYFAIGWATGVSVHLNIVYVWWVIIGIALLPGFLMSTMFFSNILNFKVKSYDDVSDSVSLIMCAYNEEENIEASIKHILKQNYKGTIKLIVVDNCSTDRTKDMVNKEILNNNDPTRSIQYVYCSKKGKSYALNQALTMLETASFITVDADTHLEENAIQRIMNKIIHEEAACVAGNLFVSNTKSSLITKMQNYDYLLSIAGIKRFQASYNTTLVAQGAFSAYDTQIVKDIGGWRNDAIGEDIVLTYGILKKGFKSLYEPYAVGYTMVPDKLSDLYRQRKRWAIGMFEAFREVMPWKQKTLFSKFFASINTMVVYFDLAYIFGFLVGVFLAIFGYYYFVGWFTLLTLIISVINFASMYIFQRKLSISFKNDILGFIFFLLFYQSIQSLASLNGYIDFIFIREVEW